MKQHSAACSDEQGSLNESISDESGLGLGQEQEEMEELNVRLEELNVQL
ncbi:hypothetical protein [Wolbachia pipientis]|nr:hypothetical protein [Wolbachia pipientis]MDM8335626.1 hypothetical protein [Wolbachia pipientis]